MEFQFDFPWEDAAEEITGFDQIAIKAAFHRDVTELESISDQAVVWALLNRLSGRKFTVEEVNAMSRRQLKALFRAEQDPDIEEGKASEPSG